MKKTLSLLAAALLVGSLAVTANAEGEPLQNYCLGATVEVSSTEPNTSFTGDLAVDGNMETRWASDYNDNESIIIDIGGIKPIGYISIAWEAAAAADFTVQIGSENGNWEHTVATVTGNESGATTVLEFEPVTGRFIKIESTKRTSEWGISIYEVVARKSVDAVDTSANASYPSSGITAPEGSVIIKGDIIGNATGWGDNPATGAAAAFDGDINTFFDPLGTGDGFCGIDAGKEFILTKIAIHPREAQLARFYGANIQGTNTPDDADSWTDIYLSVDEATEFDWIEIDPSEFDDNSGYRYYRYYNSFSHGDVAEVELYGYAADGSTTEAPAEETAPVPAETTAPETEPETAPAPETEPETTPAAETEPETVPAPAETTAPETTPAAPQTFDAGIIAAAAAVISAAGYAVSKKRR